MWINLSELDERMRRLALQCLDLEGRTERLQDQAKKSSGLNANLPRGEVNELKTIATGWLLMMQTERSQLRRRRMRLWLLHLRLALGRKLERWALNTVQYLRSVHLRWAGEDRVLIDLEDIEEDRDPEESEPLWSGVKTGVKR